MPESAEAGGLGRPHPKAVLSGGAGAVALTLRQAEFGTIGTGEFVVRDGKEAIA